MRVNESAATAGSCLLPQTPHESRTMPAKSRTEKMKEEKGQATAMGVSRMLVMLREEVCLGDALAEE